MSSGKTTSKPMHPYQTLSDRAFWRTAVADKSIFELESIWTPKTRLIRDSAISTFGSCFSQRIGQALRRGGYNWLTTETAPHGMSAASARTFNYDVFTCRTGNIYTTSMLCQWASWAAGDALSPEEYWTSDGRFLDPLRPTIEPTGFLSLEEMRRSRVAAIAAFRTAIETSDVLIFTLGLTEHWRNRASRLEYQLCPGTNGGTFAPDLHEFENHTYDSARSNLVAAIETMRRLNENLSFILTVSPVPITATLSGEHVLSASSYTKSLLRSLAGEMQTRYSFVDYFPSYELSSSAPSRGVFFKANQRQISQHGVDFVMSHFLSAFEDRNMASPSFQASSAVDEEICDEEILASFAKT